MSDVVALEAKEHIDRYNAATAAFGDSSTWTCYYQCDGLWYKGQVKQQGWPPITDIVFYSDNNDTTRSWSLPIGNDNAFKEQIKNNLIMDKESYEKSNKVSGKDL